MLDRPRLFLLSLAGLIGLAGAAGAQPVGQQQERVGASFVLAFGRTPTAAEMEEWTAGPAPVAELIARHRRTLQAQPDVQRTVVAKADRDAFGVTTSQHDGAEASAGGTYVDLMQRHLAWLTAHPADYEAVVRRAYRLVLQRDAYPVEIDYWRSQPVISFALLAGCVDGWARRNRPGLTATSGVATVSVNSDYLATVRLSPAVAAEARLAAGLPILGDTARALAAGRLVVAPGAARLGSVGGIHFAAAGAARLGTSALE